MTPEAAARPEHPLGPRFRGAVAWLVAVAVFLFLLEARVAEAVVAMLAVWLLVVLVEIAARYRELGREDERAAEAEAVPIVPQGEEHELYVAAVSAPLPPRDGARETAGEVERHGGRVVELRAVSR